MTGHLCQEGAISTPAQPNSDKRLDSWKEIAAFFERDERTVRRWEIERGLPIHRVPGAARGNVFAYPDELTRWLQGAGTPGDQLQSPSDLSTQPAEAEAQVRQPATASISDEPSAAPIPIASSIRRWRSVLWSVPVVLLAGFLLVVSFRHREGRFQTLAATRRADPYTPDPHLGPDSVAVLPFANPRGDAKTDYLSDGITESLIGNLAHVPQLKVRSRDSVFRYKGKDVEVRKVGSELGVSVLVSGRVLLQGDTIEINTELTDVRDNTEIWGHRYTGESADIILLQQQIAGDIAERLRSTLSSADKQHVTNQGTQDSEAYSLYLKGRYAWNKRTSPSLKNAISYFNRAIAKDPEYALAYSGLADAYSVLPFFGGDPSEDYSKSNAAARRALELDPTLAHPHAVLGSNEMGYDWDFAGGEAEFKKAIELDPNDATAHQWYAEDLGTLGREQEALAEINRAHQLDPLSPIISRVIGSIRVSARQYDEAISVCKQLADENPTVAVAHDCLAYAYWGKRMYPQVVEEWKAYGRISGDPKDIEFAAALDRGFRSAGWRGALTQALEVLQNRRKASYYSPLMIARFYADLGDKEQAFEWLDIAYREHDWLLMGLNTYFQVDSLRSDPRFAELVSKVGLRK